MNTQLFFSGDESKFMQFLDSLQADKFILLADANTNGFCVPILKSLIPTLKSAPLIVIPKGETNKTLDTCTLIWDQLVQLHCSRHTVIINVGGGMVSDIGAFAASVFKRGIRFVNIPTTLLAMVDACYGGKTGIDFNHTKNILGTFHTPQGIFCNSFFLQTLDHQIRNSGVAETIKHVLISSSTWWHELKEYSIEEFCDIQTIKKSLLIKKEFADKDPTDQGIRQALNFGHTIGHAIESFSLQTNTPLLHGEAVMLGLMHEIKISQQLYQFPASEIENFTSIKQSFFPDLHLEYSFDAIRPFLLQDKKNQYGIRMSLLKDIGQPELQVLVSESQIQASFE